MASKLPRVQAGSTSGKTGFASFLTNVEDDGTTTYFWRAHSITALFCLIVCLLYVSLFEDGTDDVTWNVKRGLVACIVVFCVFGMTQVRDGPFRRPHPALWRLVVCLSIVYELALVFMLFQSVDNARQLVGYLDPELGKPLPEQSYAEDCTIYDSTSGHPDGPWHNLKDKIDVFVIGHLFGWYFKMLMIRDYWVCWVISIMFEVLEYSLEHQLPNFAECWWDHWILDVLVCNGAGIWLGMKTLNYLNMKTYQWRGLWKIPSYRGKLKRIFLQFTPYNWTRFDWQPTSNLKRWLAVLGIITMYLLAELNTFYLKYILWIPPPHALNWLRLGLYVLIGSCALRETFQFLSDPECKTMGQQAWVMSAIIFTELLISLKFDLPLILKPLPSHVALGWGLGILTILTWTVWTFCIHRISFRFLHWSTKKPTPNPDPKHTTTNPKTITSNPKPTNTNPKSTTTNPKSTTTNPKSTTTNPKSTTTNPKPTTANSKSTTTNPKPTTANPKSTTTNPKATTANPKPTTTNPKPTTANPKPTTTNPKPTTNQSDGNKVKGQTDPKMENHCEPAPKNHVDAPSRTRSRHRKKNSK